MDKGPWIVGHTNAFGLPVRVFVESNDFIHDARLYIDGDFESIQERLDYAKFIADKLNGKTNE